MIKQKFLFFILLISTSCSSIHFTSTNKISLSFDFGNETDQDAKITITKPFYMWGTYPEKHIIKLDEVFYEKGFKTVTDLRIREVNSAEKALWMFFTLGMYYPQSYELVAKVN